MAFLLLLEPGNLVNVIGGGIPLPWTEEALRIAGAATLGAAVTPVLLRMTRRLPIEGPTWRARAAIHAAVITGLSLLLIVVAQGLAAWLLAGRDPRLRAPLGEELARNGALLVLSMTAFVALAHAVRSFRGAQSAHAALSGLAQRRGDFLTRIAVKTRGGVIFLALDEVDWIESQGNYLALHAGAQTHLVRQTLARFEQNLDPQQFVRIHRRTIVRTDRIRDLRHRSNGDADVRLCDGSELRLSRSYAAAAQTRLAAGAFAQPAPDLVDEGVTSKPDDRLAT